MKRVPLILLAVAGPVVGFLSGLAAEDAVGRAVHTLSMKLRRSMPLTRMRVAHRPD